jgi:hypothetical protein
MGQFENGKLQFLSLGYVNYRQPSANSGSGLGQPGCDPGGSSTDHFWNNFSLFATAFFC